MPGVDSTQILSREEKNNSLRGETGSPKLSDGHSDVVHPEALTLHDFWNYQLALKRGPGPTHTAQAQGESLWLEGTPKSSP